MKRLVGLLAFAAAVGALAVPAAANTPNGNGLYGEHFSTCTLNGEPFYTGNITLVPGNGNSFWVNGTHVVILSATVTPTGGMSQTYTFGGKTKQASGDVLRCEGEFPGYDVVSYDVVVP